MTFGEHVKRIAAGILFSVVLGLVYIVILREPGPLFYPFAALIFLGGPLVAAIPGTHKAQKRKLSVILASGSAVFGTAFTLFFVTYAVLPQFDRANVQLPAFCDGFDDGLHPPSRLAYTLPGIGSGVLLASDDQSAVVVVMDTDHPPYPSTVYLVNTSDNRILRSLNFPNNTIIATIDSGIVYLYNDKLGYLIDARSGEFQENFLLIDNYGGLSETDRPIISRASDRHWYMETTAVISSWSMDGTVRSRPHLTLNGIAFDCFISGSSGEVTQL